MNIGSGINKIQLARSSLLLNVHRRLYTVYKHTDSATHIDHVRLKQKESSPVVHFKVKIRDILITVDSAVLKMCRFQFIIIILTANFPSGVTLAHPLLVYVMPVDSPTHAAEYKCVVDPDTEDTKYSWKRQDGHLPEGVMAEKNILHFLKSTTDLNGLYICKTKNKFGEAVGSLYRHKIREILDHQEL